MANAVSVNRSSRYSLREGTTYDLQLVPNTALIKTLLFNTTSKRILVLNAYSNSMIYINRSVGNDVYIRKSAVTIQLTTTTNEDEKKLSKVRVMQVIEITERELVCGPVHIQELNMVVCIEGMEHQIRNPCHINIYDEKVAELQQLIDDNNSIHSPCTIFANDPLSEYNYLWIIINGKTCPIKISKKQNIPQLFEIQFKTSPTQPRDVITIPLEDIYTPKGFLEREIHGTTYFIGTSKDRVSDAYAIYLSKQSSSEHFKELEKHRAEVITLKKKVQTLTEQLDKSTVDLTRLITLNEHYKTIIESKSESDKFNKTMETEELKLKKERVSYFVTVLKIVAVAIPIIATIITVSKKSK